MGDSDHLKSEIRSFVGSAFKGKELTDDEDIFASGVVNSLFAMELITFLEGTYSITIENEDLELENFSTVDKLVELVERKTASSAAAS